MASTAKAELDKYDQQALKQTQDLLSNPNERGRAIEQDQSAKDVDAKVGALAGSTANKEEIYGLAGQMMERITKETNGDPEKMKKLLLEAQTNPEAFYNKMNPSQKTQISNLADKINSQKVRVPSR